MGFSQDNSVTLAINSREADWILKCFPIVAELLYRTELPYIEGIVL